MQELSIRETRTFVDGWSHLDAWRSVGGFDHVHTEEAVNDYDDEAACLIYWVRVHADQGASQDEIRNALYDAFGGSNCRHEYDCCGCWSSCVEDAQPLIADLWRVEVYASRNY